MKKIYILILIVILIIIGVICYLFMNTSNDINKNVTENTNNIQEPNNNNIEKTLESENNGEININIAVGDKNIKGILYDSETTRDFIKLLPLRINMTNFYDREYAAALGTEISTNGENIDDFSNGDITYYIAGNALAIFYNNEENSSQSGLIRIGRITSDLSDFAELGEKPEFYITLEENNSQEQEVLARYEEMEQAMIDRDMDKLNEIILDGTTFTHMSGMTQSKEEYLRDIENGELDYQEYRIENPSVTINGDEAIIEARVYLTANAYGAQGTYPFDIQSHFQRINGEWFFGSK